MSLQIITEDQYTRTEYGAGPHMLDKAKAGTRYALVGIRTLVDPNDPNDLKQVHALQDAIKVSQPGGPGKFEVPNWDKASQKKVRDALLVLASTVTDTRRAFGMKEEVDPVQYLIGAASAWGANPPRDAIYLNVVLARNDGLTNYTLKVGDVPVDGFWSISLYNAEGYYEKESVQRLHLEQHHGAKGARRVDCDPVRWLRREDAELPADYEGVELHGSPLPPAHGNPERHVEIPGGTAGEPVMSANDAVDGCAGRPAEGRRCKSVTVKA